MKLSIITLSTLAISAQAWLLPNGPLPNGPGVTYANDDHRHPPAHAHVHEHHHVPHPPCHGAHRGNSPFRAVKAWMASYGLISPPRSYSHTVIRLSGPDDFHPLSRPHKVDWSSGPEALDISGLSPEDIHKKVQEMMHDMKEEGVVPFLRGGAVRVMMNEEAAPVHEVPGGVAHPGGGLHGHAGWHHRRPNSFSGRLNRAMRNLRPAESLALAFVLGAGLGSILHMVFMLTLLLSRRIKCGRLTKEERQARRQARRQRRADKKAGREGEVRLEGQDEAICVLRAPEVEEGLPRYEDGEERVEGDNKA